VKLLCGGQLNVCVVVFCCYVFELCYVCDVWAIVVFVLVCVYICV
jgi:hypothetical protein